MATPTLFAKLYVRIWLAVVLTVAVLVLLVGAIWHLAAEPPARDVVVRNAQGQIIGRGQPRWGAEGSVDDRPGRALTPEERALRHERRMARRAAEGGDGPDFLVRMQDGQTVHMHLMRAPPSFWSRPPFGFAWMLVWVGLAVALATYPIVRTLTRRLEQLQQGVQRWGEGDLSARLPQAGRDEVAFLAERFNAAADQIQALLQSERALLASQKSLLANASHELRSPLARIRMGLELLGPQAQDAARQEIQRNIAELDQLIEEILLASRLDAQQADLGTVEPVDVIGLCAEECARVDAELAVDLPPQATASVLAVAKLLRRAVRNLLENARRHGGDDVTLGIRQQDGKLHIRVCDRGPGVPADLRERIFEPFFRLPGATERDGGVGLGLSLVKSIASRHHGQVVCEERPGGGACFVLSLPLQPPAAA